MFDIVTADDFLAKLEADYADLKANPDSSRVFLNCAITAYHLHEWVWGDWLKKDHKTRDKLKIRNKAKFHEWLIREWADFVIIQAITNGTKHFTRVDPHTECKDGAFGSGAFDVGAFSIPYLLIELKEQKRYLTGEELINGAVIFWKQFFLEHHPISLSNARNP